jgi:tyrosine-protein kinase Etk/Wzc
MQNDHNKKSQEVEDSLIQQIITKYLPYWPMFLVAICLALAIAFFYLRLTTPIYEATATILIKDEKKGNEDSKLMESLDQISSKKIVENEIEILQSRTLMENVVKVLALYAPIYEQGKVHVVSAYMISPVIIESPSPDSLESSKKINLSYDKKNQLVILNNKASYPLNQIVTTRYGLLKFIPNKYYDALDTVRHRMFFTLTKPREVADNLLGGLKVEASSKLSSVINLSYRDEVPQRAEDILNQLLKAYNLSSINEKDKLARNTLSFIEDRLNGVAHDLDSIEKKVEQYKSGKGAVDISSQGALFLQNVSANDQKIGDYNTQLSILDQVKKFVTDKDNSSAIVPSTLGVSDPMLSQLLDKLYNAELEYERLRKTVGENNPTLVSLRDQINKIRPNILQNIGSQEQSLTAARENLHSTNGAYNSILNGVPKKERDLLDISREQATKSEIYAFLLQKKEESELSYASTVSDHRVIDDAQAGQTPVSPNRRLIYLLSVVACLGICFGFITIKDSLTGKVLYRSEIETRTRFPIIGEITFEKSESPIVVQAGRRSFIAEEFRKLRISLSFLGFDQNHKKILITSSISGEGKSFIAVNLAISLALTGKKVVLVDLDLNNPTIAKILNVTQEAGITEYLKG